MAATQPARGARPRRWPGALAWTLWALILLSLPVAAWLDHLLREAGESGVSFLQLGSVPVLVAAVSAATVGALVASRRPEHPVGWLLLGLGLLVSLWGVVGEYVLYGVVARPGSLPGARYLAGISSGAFDGLLLVCTVIAVVALVAAAWSLVLRFRRARGVERQQLRWLAVGAAVAALALLVVVVAAVMSRD